MRFLIFFIVFVSESLHAAPGAAFVLPIGIQNPYQSIGPFLLWNTDVASFRYQEVYGASGFSGLDTPFLINELVFGPSGASPTPNLVLPNIQIDLSTTSKAPDGLSRVFAENVGANDTVVYSGSLNYFRTGFGGDYHIILQTPFLFDPTAGNLLMDIRNFQTPPPPPGAVRAFNRAEGTTGDSVSEAFAQDVNALSGNVDTGGLVTVFGGTLVPEPSTWALLLLSGACGTLCLARRSHRARVLNNQT